MDFLFSKHHTINAYLDRLEGAFLIRRLPPFAANLHKRLVKVGDLIKATQLVLLCRVPKSITAGRQSVTNLPDYLRAKA